MSLQPSCQTASIRIAKDLNISQDIWPCSSGLCFWNDLHLACTPEKVLTCA